ncbi:MAG: hypothetical protein ACN4GZ_06470 [Acidimicrobiales bacterium]
MPLGQEQIRSTASEIDNVLAKRASGATIAELAIRFGILRTTVMAHVKRAAYIPAHLDEPEMAPIAG